LEDSDVDGKKILQLFLKKLDVNWIHMVHDKVQEGCGFEFNNELSSSIKDG
jgi:hypothetical protein